MTHTMSKFDPRFRRGVKLDRAPILEAIRQGGQSHNDIARRFGCSSTTIGRIAREAGYTRGRPRIVGASGADEHPRRDATDGEALPKAQPKEVAHGDPRWHAWLAHWLATGEAVLAEQLRRQRRAVTVQQDWPPETGAPDVERLPLGTWSISHGTPESAAWLCVLRRSDPNAAQAHDMARRTLIRATRWPLLDAPSGADVAPEARFQHDHPAQEIAR